MLPEEDHCKPSESYKSQIGNSKVFWKERFIKKIYLLNASPRCNSWVHFDGKWQLPGWVCLSE